MRFKIQGSFEAESIDNAFTRLATHFIRLAQGDDLTDIPPAFEGSYELEVEPVQIYATHSDHLALIDGVWFHWEGNELPDDVRAALEASRERGL